ncbi:MAG: hypothetical protein D6785_06720 [Planctomycetota bacterium]|nr:MAG: hypothetical protein D6785_06720 [Planctomycetota bacterium]
MPRAPLPKLSWDRTEVLEKEVGKGKTKEKLLTLQVLEDAKSSKKPIIIFFTTTKGKVAKKGQSLENRVFASPKIVNTAKEFHAVKIDISTLNKNQLKMVVKKFHLRTLPMILILTYNGKKGYRYGIHNSTPARILTAMNYILKLNKLYLKKEKKKKATS